MGFKNVLSKFRLLFVRWPQSASGLTGQEGYDVVTYRYDMLLKEPDDMRDAEKQHMTEQRTMI